MAIILLKLPRYTMVNGHAKVVSKAGRWYVEDTSKQFSTSYGMVPAEILQSPGKHTVGKDEFCVVPAQPIDEAKALKQDVQRIQWKDLGVIAARIGVHKNMIFAESGTGSGGATSFFAPLVKKVYSYDIRKEASERVQKELDRLKITNVTFGVGSIDEIETPEQVDAFLLDVPEPWKAWEAMEKNVKLGGFVVGYTPNANQLQQFVKDAPKNFKKEHVCEIIERHWRVHGMVCRPETADFSHTAFLSFFRKIY